MSMKATVSDISSVQKRVTVAVSRELVQETYNDVLQRLRKKVSLKGFRPGKAPLNLVKQLYSDHAEGEVGEKLIQKYLIEALTTEKLNPIATPVVDRVDSVKPEQDFTFDAVIDIMPELTLPELKDVSITCKEYSFSDATIEKELQGIQQRQAKGKSLEDGTAAADGHLAVISHTARFAGGENIPDLNAEGVSVVIGRGDILPALDDMLKGMKAGEEKTDNVTLPEDYRDADLAGKTLEIKVTLNSLSELIVPALDDELAKDIGFDSLAALRSEIQKDLERQTEQMTRNDREGAVLKRIIELAPFEVPPSMVDQIIDGMISEIVPRQDEKRWQQVLKNDDIRKRFRPEAKRRAQNTLLLLKVIQDQGIKIEEAEIQAELEKIPGFSEKPAAEQKKIEDQLSARIQENKLFEKAMDWLLAQVRVEKVANPL